MSGPSRSPTLFIACALWAGVALCLWIIVHQAEEGVAVSNPWIVGLNALVIVYLGAMAVRFTLRYRRIFCRRVLSAEREGGDHPRREEVEAGGEPAERGAAPEVREFP